MRTARDDATWSRLEALLGRPVLSVRAHDPGYISSNHVWEVATADGPRIVKIPRGAQDAPPNCFWLGLEALFGADRRRELGAHDALSKYLNARAGIPAPRVLAWGIPPDDPRGPYAVYEKMPGEPAPYGSDQERRFLSTPSLMEALGSHVGRLHADAAPKLGSHSRSLSYAPDEFPDRLADTLIALAEHPRWEGDAEAQAALPDHVASARTSSPPEDIAHIMLDLSPGQFLAQGDEITALVDTESFVRGPCAMELTAVEMWTGDGEAFRRGYLRERHELPDMAASRELYRFFLYLLYDSPDREQGLASYLARPSW